ncbi:hypothetical protein M422DRAFT_247022 [Sphaerobolus stellatus SS14]|nr:hypothetical protein M422DRAFT_247022 [Sphaerobolus stellatus SS14]
MSISSWQHSVFYCIHPQQTRKPKTCQLIPNFESLYAFRRQANLEGTSYTRFIARDSQPWSPEAEMDLSRAAIDFLSRVDKSKKPESSVSPVGRRSVPDDDDEALPDDDDEVLLEDNDEVSPKDDDDQVDGYRRVSTFQGTRIPKFLEFCDYYLDTIPTGLHVAHVPGLILEFIDGIPIEDLVVGQNITKEEAEQVSHGILNSLQIIQASIGQNAGITKEQEEQLLNDTQNFLNAYNAKTLPRQGIILLNKDFIHPGQGLTPPSHKANGYRHMNEYLDNMQNKKYRNQIAEPFSREVLV